MHYCTCGSTRFESSSEEGYRLMFLSLQTNAASYLKRTIPVAVRSKAWVRGHTSAGIVGSNPAGGMDVCLV